MAESPLDAINKQFGIELPGAAPAPEAAPAAPSPVAAASPRPTEEVPPQAPVVETPPKKSALDEIDQQFGLKSPLDPAATQAVAPPPEAPASAPAPPAAEEPGYLAQAGIGAKLGLKNAVVTAARAFDPGSVLSGLGIDPNTVENRAMLATAPETREGRAAVAEKATTEGLFPRGVPETKNLPQAVIRGLAESWPMLGTLLLTGGFGTAGVLEEMGAGAVTKAIAGAAIPFGAMGVTDENPVAGVAQGAILGATLGGMHLATSAIKAPVLQWLAKIGGSMGIGGGATAIAGGGPEDIARDALIFGLFEVTGMPGGKEKPKPGEQFSPYPGIEQSTSWLSGKGVADDILTTLRKAPVDSPEFIKAVNDAATVVKPTEAAPPAEPGPEAAPTAPVEPGPETPPPAPPAGEVPVEEAAAPPSPVIPPVVPETTGFEVTKTRKGWSAAGMDFTDKAAAEAFAARAAAADAAGAPPPDVNTVVRPDGPMGAGVIGVDVAPEAKATPSKVIPGLKEVPVEAKAEPKVKLPTEMSPEEIAGMTDTEVDAYIAKLDAAGVDPTSYSIKETAAPTPMGVAGYEDEKVAAKPLSNRERFMALRQEALAKVPGATVVEPGVLSAPAATNMEAVQAFQNKFGSRQGAPEGLTTAGERMIPGETPSPDTPGISYHEAFPRADIQLNPDVWQHKMAETGAGQALAHVKNKSEWDAEAARGLSIYRYPDGHVELMDGHSRTTAGDRVGVPHYGVRIYDGNVFSVEAARATAALTNIRLGTGTVVDSAKAMRDFGLTPETLREKGIDLNGGHTRIALGLSNLSDEVFGLVARGDFPAKKGAIIGEQLPGNPEAQNAIYKLIQKKHTDKNGVISISDEKLRNDIRFAEFSKVMPTNQPVLGDVFEESMRENLVSENSDLMTFAARKLSTEKNLFKTVTTKSAQLVAAGNELKPEANKKISDDAAMGLAILDKAPFIPGTETNRLFKEFAVKLAETSNKTPVKEEFYAKLPQALEADRDAAGLGTGVGRGIRQEVSATPSGTPAGEGTAPGEPAEPPLFSLKEAKERAPAFFSRMREHIEAKLPGKGSPENMVDLLETWAGMKQTGKNKKGEPIYSKGEFKRDELLNSGVIPWIKEQKGSVTKQQVMEYLDTAGRVVLTDVDKEGSIVTARPPGTATKYSQYQLPGSIPGTYFEKVITLESKRDALKWTPAESAEAEKLAGHIRGDYGRGPTPAEQARWEELKAKQVGANAADYKSPHWDEKNPVAHIRGALYKDVNGDLVMTVNGDWQADWVSAGRHEGWRLGPKEMKEVQRRRDLLTDEHQGVEERKIAIKNTPATPGLEKEFNDLVLRGKEIEKEAVDLNNQMKGVPQHPFPNTWQEFVMKKLLRMVAEQNVERAQRGEAPIKKLAWTTGQQQFERWGTDRVDWKKVEPGEQLLDTQGNGMADGGYIISATEQHRGIAGGVDIEAEARARGHLLESQGTGVTSKEELLDVLKGTLNRERSPGEIEKLTDRIWAKMQQEPEGTSMPRKEFFELIYDKAPKKFLNPYAKQWGAEVGKAEIEKGTPGQEYTGTPPPPKEIQDAIEDQRLAVEIKKQAMQVYEALTDGNGHLRGDTFGSNYKRKFNEAMSQYGSQTLAHYFGGDLTFSTGYQTVHSIDITPPMEASVLYRGQAMYSLKDIPPEERLAAFQESPLWKNLNVVEKAKLMFGVKEVVPNIALSEFYRDMQAPGMGSSFTGKASEGKTLYPAGYLDRIQFALKEDGTLGLASGDRPLSKFEKRLNGITKAYPDSDPERVAQALRGMPKSSDREIAGLAAMKPGEASQVARGTLTGLERQEAARQVAPGATLFPEMGAGGGGTLFDQAPEPARVPAGARPAVVEAPKTPLRFDNQTGRYNGEKLERGDILTDKEGNRYQLDRQMGYMLGLDQINEKGRPIGSKSISVEPTDKTRYRDLFRTGDNAYSEEAWYKEEHPQEAANAQEAGRGGAPDVAAGEPVGDSNLPQTGEGQERGVAGEGPGGNRPAPGPEEAVVTAGLKPASEAFLASPEHRTAEALAKKEGIERVTAVADAPFDAALVPEADGTHTLVISETISRGTHEQQAGHEVTHAKEKAGDPETLRLIESIDTTTEAFQAYKDKLNDLREKRGMPPLDDRAMASEVAADLQNGLTRVDLKGGVIDLSQSVREAQAEAQAATETPAPLEKVMGGKVTIRPPTRGDKVLVKDRYAGEVVGLRPNGKVLVKFAGGSIDEYTLRQVVVTGAVDGTDVVTQGSKVINKATGETGIVREVRPPWSGTGDPMLEVRWNGKNARLDGNVKAEDITTKTAQAAEAKAAEGPYAHLKTSPDETTGKVGGRTLKQEALFSGKEQGEIDALLKAGDFAGVSEKMQRIIDEKKAWADENVRLAGENPSGVKLQSTINPNKQILIHRSTDPAYKGKWQITQLDKWGEKQNIPSDAEGRAPIGHQIAPTLEAAIRQASDEYDNGQRNTYKVADTSKTVEGVKFSAKEDEKRQGVLAPGEPVPSFKEFEADLAKDDYARERELRDPANKLIPLYEGETYLGTRGGDFIKDAKGKTVKLTNEDIYERLYDPKTGQLPLGTETAKPEDLLGTPEKPGPEGTVEKPPGYVAGIVRSVREKFSAANISEKARLAHQYVVEHLGWAAREVKKDAAILDKYLDRFGAMTQDDLIKFTDAAEQGRLDQVAPDLQEAAGAWRRIANGLHSLLVDAKGGESAYWENYFPRLFENPEQASIAIAQLIKSRGTSLTGPESMNKARTMLLFSDSIKPKLEIKAGENGGFDVVGVDGKTVESFTERGLAEQMVKEQGGLGLTPRYPNYVDMMKGNIYETVRFLTGKYIESDLKDAGFITNSKTPGWEDLGKLGDKTLDGYYAHPDVARVMENFLSKGLRGDPLFELYNSPASFMNTVMVGMSAFHATFSTFSDLAHGIGSNLSRAIGAAVTGRFGLSGHYLAEMAKAGNIPANVMRGGKLGEEYTTPGSHPEMSAIVDLLTKAGIRFESPGFKDTLKAIFQPGGTSQTELGQMSKTFAEVAAQQIGIPRKVMETIAWPIMSYLVPRLKINATARLLQMELDTLTRSGKMKDMAPEDITRLAQEVARKSDNIFGQMVYDNLSMSRGMRDGMRTLVGFPGWNIGSFTDILQASKGIGQVGYQSGKAVWDIAHGQKPTWENLSRSNRMSLEFYMGTVMVMAVFGAITQRLLTGAWPDNAKDLMMPQTGELMANGQPERLRAPTYMRDVLSLNHPFEMAKHKLNWPLRMMSNLVSNQDFFGTQIRDPYAGAGEQAGQVGKFVGKSLLPFGIQGYMATEAPKARALNLIGVTKVPRLYSNTDAMNVIDEYNTQNRATMTSHEAEAEKNLKGDLRKLAGAQDEEGFKDAAQTAMEEGTLTKQQVKSIVAESQAPPGLGRFVALPVEWQVRAMAKATDQERALWQPYFLKKIQSAKSEILIRNRDILDPVLREMGMNDEADAIQNLKISDKAGTVNLAGLGVRPPETGGIPDIDTADIAGAKMITDNAAKMEATPKTRTAKKQNRYSALGIQ